MTFSSSDHLGSNEVDLKSHIPGHHLLKLVLSAILKTTELEKISACLFSSQGRPRPSQPKELAQQHSALSVRALSPDEGPEDSNLPTTPNFLGP